MLYEDIVVNDPGYLDDERLRDYAVSRDLAVEWRTEHFGLGWVAIVSFNGTAMPAAMGRNPQSALDIAIDLAMAVVEQTALDMEPLFL